MVGRRPYSASIRAAWAGLQREIVLQTGGETQPILRGELTLAARQRAAVDVERAAIRADVVQGETVRERLEPRAGAAHGGPRFPKRLGEAAGRVVVDGTA